MQLSDILIIFLLLSCVTLWIINMNKKCPDIRQQPPQIIYKFRPDLDLQFNPTNFPSEIYSEMFKGGNIAQGGMSNDRGRNTGGTLVTNQNKTGGTL